jgi:phosphatidylglycerol:prolipoprotein diacylglycerol transferase
MYFLRFDQGGMAFFGGLIGVILVLLFFGRKSGLSFSVLGDVCTVPAAVGLGIGRIANFINGELPGNRTDGSWGVIFPNWDPGHPRHPSVLYEMVTHFLLAILLVWVGRQSWARNRVGVLGAVFVIGYGLMRVVTEHFREADTYLGPLTSGQVASLVIAAVGGIVLIRILRKLPQESKGPG